MDQEFIILKEIDNNGSSIYIYKDSVTDAWSTYGNSAYALRLIAKEHELDNIKLFSPDLELPCTIINRISINRLIANGVTVIEDTEEYMILYNPISFKREDYFVWSNKLINEYKGIANVDINTPISENVPKNGYIKDNMTSFSRNAKRIIDLFTSAICLIVFSPLILICYIAIKLDDGGPAIFKQERIGRFGRPFYIYKFRSMRLDAEKMGPQLSSSGGEGDSRLTKVGAFLRAHHLDELPQLWNVFIGDMAFIGPRPERKYFIDQILDYDKRYTYLYQIRPGVTSYATLYNGYTDTIDKMLKRLEYDLYYLKRRTLWLDFSILCKTFCRIIFGKIF